MVLTAKGWLNHVWCVPTPAQSRDDMEWRALFGRRLRELRIARELTQEALAEIAGVDRKLVYRTELAQTSPRLDAVRSLARALGVDIGSLVAVDGGRRAR